MKRQALMGLMLSVATGWFASGCCPELRQVLQRDAVDAKPASGTERHFSFATEDCFDESKQITMAVLWKSGKQQATLSINDLDVAELPAQTCDLVEQTVTALGDAVGGAIGDLGCALHLVQGPDLSHEDQVLTQDQKKAGFEWKLFKLPEKMVKSGRNDVKIAVSDSTEQCSGEDKRGTTQVGYMLMSDVDDVCDDKFTK